MSNLPTSAESRIVYLIGAVQFVNILDFTMVMPLGPDFAVALGIPTSHLGYIAGSYTAAAAVAGLLGSLFLDRFDRRSALALALVGLALGTASGGLATSFGGLMAARVLAGLFGGPATSLALSIIADVVPAERRGKAMGKVMGAFSLAQIFGVPAGLILAERGGWRMPFFAVAAIGLLVALGARVLLPPMRAHLAVRAAAGGGPSYGALLGRPAVRLSYAMTAVVMMAGFILIPNLAAYMQGNLHFPRASLSLLYLAGGITSVFAMRLAGRAVDRWGAFRVAAAATPLLLAILFFGFVRPMLPAPAIFVGFMLVMAFRNISYNTLTSRVPSTVERARFMSIQSSVQHLASAGANFFASRLLSELPDHRLVGMEQVGLISMALTAMIPLLIWRVEREVVRGNGTRVAPQASAARR